MPPESFSSAIDLVGTWPITDDNDQRMTISAEIQWASSFLICAEHLYHSVDLSEVPYITIGPILHNLGIASELVLKALLKGARHDEKSLRKIGHNTYDAYLACVEHIDEVKFINLVMSNTANLQIPAEVSERFPDQPDEANRRWRCLFDHLRALDSVYDRPFKTRYITPGSVVLPEPYIVIVGLKILLQAMTERSQDI